MYATGTHLDAERVAVTFNDGHRVVFEPYRHGWGYQIEGLRLFSLIKPDGTIACVVNCRLYRAGPQDDEGKIREIAEDYSQELVALYWGVAKRFVTDLFGIHSGETNDDYWYHWRVAQEGWQEYDCLRQGQLDVLTMDPIDAPQPEEAE